MVCDRRSCKLYFEVGGKIMKDIKYKMNTLMEMCKFIFRESPKSFMFAIVLCLLTLLMTPVLLKLNYLLISYIEISVDTKVFDYSSISILIILLIICSAISRISGYSNIILFDKLQVNIGVKLMNKAYKRTGTIEHQYFDSADNAAKIQRMALYSQDSMLTQNVVHLISVCVNILSLILIIPVTIKFGWVLYITMIIISIIIHKFNFDEGYKRWEFNKKQEPLKRKQKEDFELLQNKNVIKEIKILKCLQFLTENWENQYKSIFKKEYRFELDIQRKKLLFDIASIVVNTLPFILIAFLLSTYKINFAQMFLLWQTQEKLTMLIDQIISEWKMVYFSIEYIDEVMDYINEEEKIIESDSGINVQDLFVLNNVSFAYKDTVVLNNINIKIREGEKVVILGLNGVGKTTLIKLMLGLYKPQQGEIFYNGKQLMSENTGMLYKQIGVVWQDYANFELSLREDIGFGKIDEINNNMLIENALDKVNLSKYNDFEMVLGKSFEEEGVIPSGGEWQRIAIARSYFGDKKVIFMDEPTASLDPISEVNQFRHIKEAYKENTVVVISHRIGVARMADRILVLDEGEIIEDGSHDELIRSNGAYSRFYKAQATWYEEVN